MTRKERLARISQLSRNPLGDDAKYNIQNGQVKVGAGPDFTLFETRNDGHASIRTNVHGNGNPGFTFGSSGSEFRTGPVLRVQAQLDNVTWNGRAMNPMNQHLPPNIVNFYKPMLPNVSDLAHILRGVARLGG